MATKTTIRNRINREISKMDTYHNEIPTDEIWEAIENHGGVVIDEAGERWSGLFCGEQGQASMAIVFPEITDTWARSNKVTANMFVHISWYKMDSGRYEIVCYVS